MLHDVHTTAVVEDVIGVSVEQLGIEVGNLVTGGSGGGAELLIHVIGGTIMRNIVRFRRS